MSKERRKRELQKITKQNQKILKRIQGARPTYNHKAWEQQAKDSDRILTNICEFKPKKASRQNSEKLADLYDDEYLLEFEDDFEWCMMWGKHFLDYIDSLVSWRTVFIMYEFKNKAWRIGWGWMIEVVSLIQPSDIIPNL